jgi:uncharacterized membrane protein YvlD (DUF360 family)/uncharacterized protein YdbL (DUF1318 family)
MIDVVRSAEQRPDLLRIAARATVVTVAATLALWLMAALLGGFDIDSPGAALLAGAVVGLSNALVWPLLASVVVPLSVLTLGLGAIVIDAALIGTLLHRLPGIEVDGLWTAVVLVIGIAVISTTVSSALAVDDDEWVDRRTIKHARRRFRTATRTDVPGVVFVQIDGVAEVVLRRALKSGDAPTIDGWLRTGSHQLVGWQTGWSSQTGVSQCGILHGSTDGMPAFRWVDKLTGTVVVSNRKRSAAMIERAHSDGHGLLEHHGSSYCNLFSGDAERSVLTMSGAGSRKEGRIGAGYAGYFSKPQQAAHTLIHVVTDIARERRAALQQRRRLVEPRVHRTWLYAGLRAFTTVVSRDVAVQGVLNDIAEGRAAIYVDLLGYDEVAHHSGPERWDSLAVLRDLDRQLGRIARSFRWAPRPYRIVVLSDHGQTQGAPFAAAAGETLAELVGRLCGGAASGDSDAERGRTESSAWWRKAMRQEETNGSSTVPTVLASGSLGLISLPGPPRRLRRHEIDERYPSLLDGLVGHPYIGFVLVGSNDGSLVLGPAGHRNLATGEVVGDDPLAPYGPRAVEQVAEIDAYETVADVMVNARYDPERDEVAAFETQVGSHGGLGGPQTHPFLLHPSDLEILGPPIFTAVGMHRVLKTWLADLGHPVVLGWRTDLPHRGAVTPDDVPSDSPTRT